MPPQSPDQPQAAPPANPQASAPASGQGAAAEVLPGTEWGTGPRALWWPRLAEATVITGACAEADAAEGVERVIVDIAHVAPGGMSYHVAYVDAVRPHAVLAEEPGAESSGPVRGGAVLEVLIGSPTQDEQGPEGWEPADRERAVDVEGLGLVEQVVLLGSARGMTQLAVRLRERAPFTASAEMTQEGQWRLVVTVPTRPRD